MVSFVSPQSVIDLCLPLASHLLLLHEIPECQTMNIKKVGRISTPGGYLINPFLTSCADLSMENDYSVLIQFLTDAVDGFILKM